MTGQQSTRPEGLPDRPQALPTRRPQPATSDGPQFLAVPHSVGAYESTLELTFDEPLSPGDALRVLDALSTEVDDVGR